MNIERLSEIATWLEAGAPHEEGGMAFNMNYVYLTQEDAIRFERSYDLPKDCGSVACIAGTAVAWYNPYYLTNYCEGFAADVLGLSEEEGDMLFYPWDHYDGDGQPDLSPKSVAKVIRNLIKTGEVDWHVADKKERY